MNRTTLFLSLAGALALLAVVLGRPFLPSSGGGGGDGIADLTHSSGGNGSLKLHGRLSHPFVTPDQRDLFLTVDVNGAEVPGEARRPVNLALVIDRSGSMAGEKLERAKEAARHLVRQLRDGDSLAVVHYGSDVQSLGALKGTAVNRERMLAYIDRITDDGGTNIGAGLSTGQRELRRFQPEYDVNRIILISDGQPTEGLTEPDALTQLVRQIRAERFNVSSIGVGTDFNEDLMQSFAEYGAGAYGYLRDSSQLAEIFQQDLQQAGKMVARDVQLRFELPKGVELDEVLGYRFEKRGSSVSVPLTDFSAGQTERVVVQLRITPAAPGGSFDVAGLRLDYQDLLANKAAAEEATLASMVTEKKEEVLARQDKEATVFATRAVTSMNMKRAATSLSEGRRDEAVRYLERNAAHLDAAAQVAGEAAIADDRTTQAEQLQEMRTAAAPEEIQHATKKAKIQALKGTGRMGSTYFRK